MKIYVVRYRDASGDSPVFAQRIRANDKLEAEERFFEGADSDGWEVVSIAEGKQPDETSSRYASRHQRDAASRHARF